MARSAENLLGTCQLFRDVGATRRSRLAALAEWTTFAKGHTIFRQGDPCPGIYIVDSGMVRVYKSSPTGKEHVLHMVGPGQTFAEVAAIGEFPCPAHAQAVARSRCLLIRLAPFRKELLTDHTLCVEMMAGLSMWVRRLITLMEDLVLRDATGRVARYLLEAETAVDGTTRLPSLKRYIASHLNLTSETLSRTLSRLIEAGLVIELDAGRVEIRDRARLAEISRGEFPAV